MNYNDPYEERYEIIGGGYGPIHWTVKFGKGVKIGRNVVIDEGVTVGNNVFIGHNTVIRSGVKIGNNSIIGHLVVIEADTTVGEHVTIQSQCHITKLAVIENDVFFGPMAMCINTQHISHGRSFKPKLNGPRIKRGARIGSGSVLMPGVIIGEEAEIGANSTITKNCDAFGVYIGSPAVKKRRVHIKERY